MCSSDLIVAMFMVAGISVFQEYRSEKAVSALRDFTQAKAKVIRNNQEFEINDGEVVVGDLLLVEEGCRIPADANLIDSNDLSVDESLLTGESLPVQKLNAGDKLYAGTLVFSGRGRAHVTAVGTSSEIGKLGYAILQIGRAHV